MRPPTGHGLLSQALALPADRVQDDRELAYWVKVGVDSRKPAQRYDGPGTVHGMTRPALHISRSVDADVRTVVALAGNPANLPLWAAGLSAGISQESGRWYADSPMGRVEVAFTGPIEAGVLDHDVTLPDGTVVHNPLRVVPDGDRSVITFTLFQRNGMTEEELRADARQVEEDLVRLAQLLERGPS